MVNFDLIIEKIMKMKGFHNEKEIANLFDLSGPDFSNRKKRGTLLYFVVEWAINENVSLDEVILGKTKEAVGEPSVDYRPENYSDMNRIRLTRMLARILDEGNEKKIKAVESQLDLLDPGEKKPGGSNGEGGSPVKLLKDGTAARKFDFQGILEIRGGYYAVAIQDSGITYRCCFYSAHY